MGRGSSNASVTRNREPNINPADVGNKTDMLSQRLKYTSEVDDVMKVSQKMQDDFGIDESAVNQFMIAETKGSASGVLGLYDSNGNLSIAERFMDSQAINSAYDDCVKSGFHPSRGRKSGMEAVTAHEYGHALTDAYGKAVGITGIDNSATDIVNKARKETGHRGNVIFASKISRYATTSNAETVAEALSDVYCNGKRAKRESLAIHKIIKSTLGGK